MDATKQNSPEVYEKALSQQFSSGDSRYRLALALLAAGQPDRALIILKSCISQDASGRSLLAILLAAKVCVLSTHQPKQAARYASRAVQTSGPTLARSLHIMGVACNRCSIQAVSLGEKKAFQQQSLDALLAAREADPLDTNVLYNLALQYAQIREIAKALKCCHDVLATNRGHAPAWNLLSLLLSSRKQYTQALKAIQTGLAYQPKDSSLLVTKAQLDKEVDGHQSALPTYQYLIHHANNSSPKLKQISFDLQSRNEHSYDQSGTTPQVPIRESDLWLSASETYRELGMQIDASYCLNEAGQLDPFSANIYFQQAALFEQQQRLDEALASYETTLFLNPRHTRALVGLGKIHLKEQRYDLAEHFLTEALRWSPTDHTAWQWLALALEEQGRYDQASDAFKIALELEDTSPALEFEQLGMVV
mmetsp:Transcript_15562/g.25769  ORF Transcript_15562/g.25769 Transcript_15562/m.25769 type:complete len:422 (+) Transcript_15562:52-1317(+)